MHQAEINRIISTVGWLKERKARSFQPEAGLFDFKTAKETCRLADMLLLPLYYAWEREYKRELKDIQFEPHLQQAYNIFARHPQAITQVLCLWVMVEPATEMPIQMKYNLLSAYQSIVKE